MDWDTPIEGWNDTNTDTHWNTKDGLYARALMAIVCRATADEESNSCPT